ncbi:hypothetical protein B5K08_31925 [Rhizobium leguminosarum bv. trifolii]|uniref:Uncharacterized protein n=1 Tax=Rhizobium leguminosarum bv. trifolii TaxID=386 RepID=A0A3E1AYX6_RHILT|nr:hypothetical protein B5K10_31920 [Rhizobium leguminosarum bv. trifolii]RFB82812.1 hypothetical protein B5K08_31925 [Rhizobium leguminosarum bv. trifolii]
MQGTERVRHITFSPRAGRRCRQADEGLTSPISWAWMSRDAEFPLVLKSRDFLSKESHRVSRPSL